MQQELWIHGKKNKAIERSLMIRVLTAMAGGRPPRTSPRPPVLLHGAISAPTKTTFMPAVAQTTRDGNLPPRRASAGVRRRVGAPVSSLN